MSTHTPHTLNDWLGYCFPAEMDELTRLARLLPEYPRVLNIGAGGGVSGATFMASRPDLFLTTIDIQDTASPFGSLESERTALESCGLWDPKRHVQYHGSSHVWPIGWHAETKFDLIYIDGDHEFDGAKADILLWLAHVAQNGFLSIHDYDKGRLTYGIGPGRPHPLVLEGVDQAVQELLLGKYPLESQVDSLITFRIPGGSDAP